MVRSRRPFLGDELVLVDGRRGFVVSVRTARDLWDATEETERLALDLTMKSRMGPEWLSQYWEATVRVGRTAETFEVNPWREAGVVVSPKTR